ncbi:IS66 family insertion sequence element accessory protein TnpA [Bacillus methanolicus]|uniref:IS66 family insertion sequence element accessory protein TnpA n=1 Tax=Bacillus methanolicus TaxID=1471 RepID=UPI0009DA81CA
MAEFKDSGLTQSDWCKTNDLSIHQLKYWLIRIDGSKSIQKTSTQWVPITLEESPSQETDSLQIKIGAVSTEVKTNFNPTLFADVVKVLKTIC